MINRGREREKERLAVGQVFGNLFKSDKTSINLNPRDVEQRFNLEFWIKGHDANIVINVSISRDKKERPTRKVWRRRKLASSDETLNRNV